MATYKSQYTGQQIDQAVGNALNKDTSTLSNDVNHIPASSVVKSALTPVAVVSVAAGTNIQIMWNETVQIGNIVIVAMRLKATATTQTLPTLLTGLPLPRFSGTRGGNWICMLSNSKGINIAVTDQGNVLCSEAWAADSNAIITGTYCV